MITLLLHLLRLLPFLFGGHRQLALENLALRQQLAVYKRTIIRPPLRPTDRFFWIGLAKIWTGWRQALVIVTPATVLHWQRLRFREYWTKLSGSSNGGRPQVQAEIKALILRGRRETPVANIPRQPGRGFGLPRFLHGPHCALARPLCSRRAGSPSATRRPLQLSEGRMLESTFAVHAVTWG